MAEKIYVSYEESVDKYCSSDANSEAWAWTLEAIQ